MSSKPSEQSYSQIKWRETPYGLQIGKAAGFAFQVRDMGEGNWVARMKIWSVGARFETVADGLASGEEAMEQCENAYLAAREHFATTHVAPMPEPEMPMPRRSSSIRQAVGTETLVAEAVAEAPRRRARQEAQPQQEVAYQEVVVQEAIQQEPEPQPEPEMRSQPEPVYQQPTVDEAAIVAQFEELLQEVAMERDRAIAAFHAALCRNPGIIPSRYNDLYQEDHFEILEFKDKTESTKEPVASKRKKVAEPVG
jgi:hypothetical protein